MTSDEIENLVMAQKLIRAGLRLSIVQPLTKITTLTARSLWYEAHGKKPPNGKLPESSFFFMVNSTDAANLSAFAAFYTHTYGKNHSFSVIKLIESTEEFNRLIPNFNINAAYRVIKDLCIGLITLKRCVICNANFVYSTESKRASRCPFCRPREGVNC